MSRWIAALCALPLLAGSATPPSFRLGGAVRPTHYKLDLTVLPAAGRFSGTMDIDLDIREASSIIWLNAVGLRIGPASLNRLKARVITGHDQFAGFAVDRPVGPGAAALHIPFNGKLNDGGSAGLFRVKEGGDWYAFSQFEAIDARSAFPCFDEPSFKAPWQLTLHVKQHLTALSNTPAVSETADRAGLKTVVFAETRPLPSYLIAVAAGPFDVVDAGRAGMKRTPIRIITPRGRAAEAKHAAESTPPILALLEKYFGSPFPYEKLDEIAVPLLPGAMENAGLVTYACDAILGKPQRDSISRRREFAVTAAHELAHQWLGDVVTAAWWNDIWLNEALATWMESKIIAEWKPEWRMDVSQVVSRSDVMKSDILASARRIREPVRSNGDIANAFDGITYEKGAAVIRMFETWIGRDTFRDGVRRYAQRHAWGSASADDFLKAISEAAGRDIAPAFSSFLEQAGVPLVSMGLRCDPPGLTLKQSRELPPGSRASPAQTWQIPLCVRYPGGRECALITQAASELKLKTASCPAWLLGNDGETGYYRVQYAADPQNAPLTVAERVGLIMDTEALAADGIVPIGQSLSLVTRLHEDSDRFILTSLVGVAAGVRAHLVPEALRPNYQRFVRAMFGAKARELGWQPRPGEADDTQLLRQALVPFVASAGEDRGLIAEAERLAEQWLRDRNAIAPELTTEALRVAAEFGGKRLFDHLHAAARKTKDDHDREEMLTAMGSFRDPAIAKQSLALMLRREFDSREAASLLYGPLAHEQTRSLPFEFVKKNYNALVSISPRTVDLDFAAELPQVASVFCSEERYAEVKSFFSEHMETARGGARNLAQVLEQIQLCAARKKAQEQQVGDFLRSY